MRTACRRTRCNNMTVARFFETLLLRDVFSYLVPGALSLLVAVYYGVDGGLLRQLLVQSVALFGPTAASLVAAGVAYISGYLISTAAFYVRSTIIKRSPGLLVPSEVLATITAKFGQWAQFADARYLATLCLQYVEVQQPDYYFEKFERRIVLRNLEVSLAAVAFLASAVVIYAAPSWHRLWAMPWLLASCLILYSSAQIERAIDRYSFTSFLVVAAVEQSSSAASAPNYPMNRTRGRYRGPAAGRLGRFQNRGGIPAANRTSAGASGAAAGLPGGGGAAKAARRLLETRSADTRVGIANID